MMPDCDQGLTLLAAFHKGQLRQEAVDALLTHITGCATCRKKLSESSSTEALSSHPFRVAIDRGGGSIPKEAYSRILDKVFLSIIEENRGIEDQRSNAAALFAELSSLSFTQQELLIRNSSRYHVWALAERFLAESRRRWTEDPRHSEDLAQLAVEIAQQLKVAGFRARLLSDLKAEAWSYVANCRRIRTDYYEALRAFRKAELFLAQGSGDRLERARLLDLKASLFVAQRDFQTASRLLTETIAEYRSAGDKHLEGRALIKKAMLLRDSGEVEEAILVLQRVGRLIDVDREPWLSFALRKNLLNYLVEAGRAEEAQKMLPEVREIARQHANRLERLRLLWTEGLLCRALGQHDLALEALRQVREGFIAVEIGYDAALVSLDLALVYLEADRRIEARSLALESVPLFASRGIHREVVMAWTLFREAAERDAVTLGLVQEVASRIRHSQPRPNETADAP